MSHAAAIAACDRASKWRHAFELLERWDQQGGDRDAVMFNAAISACATCAEWQQSCALWLGIRKPGLGCGRSVPPCLKLIVSHLPCKPRERTDPCTVYCKMSPQRHFRLSDMRVHRLPTSMAPLLTVRATRKFQQ